VPDVQGMPLKKIVKYATARGFTDIIVLNEDRKHVNGLLLIHLPNGPTAHFKLSSLKLSKDIKVSMSCLAMHPVFET
jgi:ribosome production factor 1